MWKRNVSAPPWGDVYGEYVTELYFYERLSGGGKGPPIENGSRWVVFAYDCICPSENMTRLENPNRVIIQEVYYGNSHYTCPVPEPGNGKQLPWALSGSPGDPDDSHTFDRRVCYNNNQ